VLLTCDDFGELSLTINGGRHGSNYWPWYTGIRLDTGIGDIDNLKMAITITRNGESGKGIGEWGMLKPGILKWGISKTRNTKSRNL
jgi:hypothetical protein